MKRANEIRILDGYKCAMCGKSDVEYHTNDTKTEDFINDFRKAMEE